MLDVIYMIVFMIVFMGVFMGVFIYDNKNKIKKQKWI